MDDQYVVHLPEKDEREDDLYTAAELEGLLDQFAERDKPFNKLFDTNGEGWREAAADLAKEAWEIEGYRTIHGNPRHYGSNVELSGNVVDEDGNNVAHFTREIRDRGIVVHSHLEVDPDFQGSGFAAKFNQNAEEAYKRWGFKAINVHADIDVGKYAWAQQGYDFSDDDARDGHFNLLRDDFADDFVPVAAREEFRQWLDQKRANHELDHAWQFAALDDGEEWYWASNTKDGNGHLGKAFMLWGPEWSGYKVLDEEDEGYQLGQIYYDKKGAKKLAASEDLLSPVAPLITKGRNTIPLELPEGEKPWASDEGAYDLEDESEWLAAVKARGPLIKSGETWTTRWLEAERIKERARKRAIRMGVDEVLALFGL